MVSEAGEVLGGFGGEAGDAGCEPGLWGDGDLGTAVGYGGVDFAGGAADGGGDDGGSCGEGEPALLLLDAAGELGVGFATGAHEAGADGGNADAFAAQLGVQALGEAYEGEFTGHIREHVGHGEFSADAGDVDDGGVAGADLAVQQMRECCVDGVDCGEEVGGHGAAIGFEGLVFDRADFDDAGIVDEDVDVAEVVDGVIDEHGSLGGVGQVGGNEKDVVGRLDGVALEQGFAGLGEFFYVAGGEDEAGSGASVALGQGETEAAGTSGDEYDSPPVAGASLHRNGVGSGCGRDAGCCRGGAS